MATQYVTVNGTFYWAKIFDPDTFGNATRYIVDFEPAGPEDVAAIKASGIRLKPKETKDGKTVYRFRRDVSKIINNTLVNFCPPEVSGVVEVHYENADGEKARTWDQGMPEPKRVGTPITIGNGSKGALTFVAYDSSMGRGSRLESIRIDELEEYKRADAETSTQVGGQSASASDSKQELPW